MGHIKLCPGLTAGSMLRDHSWGVLGNVWGTDIKPGSVTYWQSPYLPYYNSGPREFKNIRYRGHEMQKSKYSKILKETKLEIRPKLKEFKFQSFMVGYSKERFIYIFHFL